MSEESLELAQVQDAFREAERKFQDLAVAAQNLESVSGQLGDAKAAIAEAGARLGELADASRSVAEQLAEATRTIEATDPAEIQKRLRELASSLEDHAGRSAELLAAVSSTLESHEATRNRQNRLQLILSIVTLLAVIAVAALVLIQ